MAEFEDLPEGIYQITLEKLSKRFRWNATKQYTFNMDTFVIQLMIGARPAADQAVELAVATDKGRKSVAVHSNSNGQMRLFNLNTNAKYFIISNGVELPVEWDASRKATVQLQSKTVMLVGARIADTKQPVENLKICIGRDEGGRFSKLSEGWTNANGIAKLGSFEQGEYYLVILQAPAGVKLIKQQMRKPIRVLLEGEKKTVVINAALDTENVLLDEDIPQDVSSLYSHIVKYRDGRVVLTWRYDGSKETTTVSQLGLRDLEMYK